MANWEDVGSSLVFPRKGNVFWNCGDFFLTGQTQTVRQISEWFELGIVRVKVSVEKAILVVMRNGEERWVPRSQIVEAVSDIKKNAWRGQSGLLAISEWFAAKQGW